MSCAIAFIFGAIIGGCFGFVVAAVLFSDE